MLRLDQNIIIYDQNTQAPKLGWTFITDCEIKSSRETFTDTAIVKLPQRTYRQNKKISDIINIGDIIEIYIGYFDEIEPPPLEFKGYISGINPDSPMILTCEDEAFKYKKESVGPLKLSNTTLLILLSTVYQNSFVAFDVKIGTWTVDQNATLIDILDELRTKLGILSFWQDGILYVNAELLRIPNKTVLFDVQKNVPAGSDNLNVQSANDMQTISHGLSQQKNGTKIEVFSFYSDASGKVIVSTTAKPQGVLNTLKIPELSLIELTKLTEQRLPKLFYAGVDGTIKTFGAPSFIHGDLGAVRDSRLSDRNGIYQINEVVKNFGVSSGYKQTAKLGLKVASL